MNFKRKQNVVLDQVTFIGDQDRRLLITGYFIKGRVKGGRIVESNMTEDEVNQFEEDWEKYSD